MICACVSTLLQLVIPVTLVGNRDDSNRDEKSMETLIYSKKCLYHNIDANNTFSVLGLILIAAFYFSLKDW